MSWPALKRKVNLKGFELYLDGVSFNKGFTPFLVTIHNTALPTDKMWEDSCKKDIAAGIEPGLSRIKSLENFFKVQQGWPSGPHLFIYRDDIWLFTPLNEKGTHSPSWNGIAIGIEMVADFSKEDDDSGPGLITKNTTIAVIALLCQKLKINPLTGVKLHKEDKKTTHDCPGIKFAQDKEEVIEQILERMGHAGDFVGETPLKRIRTGKVIVPANDILNVRKIASASSPILFKLNPNAEIKILNEEFNVNTKWYYIQYNNITGWASAKYIKEI